MFQDGATHTVQHYDVATRVFSPATAAVYTHEDNAACVATDTQRNAVYLVAKRSKVQPILVHGTISPSPTLQPIPSASSPNDKATTLCLPPPPPFCV